MPSETEIENDIKAAGLSAPRITPAMLDAEIMEEDYHVFPGSCLTVCALTLQNGFTVTGESACASPENFNAEIGRKIAREKARDKIWAFLGFRLRDRLSGHGAGRATDDDNDPFLAAVREALETLPKKNPRDSVEDHIRDHLRRRGFLAVADADIDATIATIKLKG